jgi:peptidoglycan/xylan/chitin deacetylase (PgdA/CDA1 family)
MDRPFTPDELRTFAAHPLISIGNHTANHAILTHYDDDSLYDQLQRCQQSLLEITGTVPVAIAYPNGGYDSRVIKACRELGLNLGYTTEPAKLPATGADPFRIGRFAPGGSASIRSQCHAYRSDLNTYRSLRSFYLNTFRPRSAA